MDYITIDDIKVYTGATYTAEQEVTLTAIGDALEDQMERYCNRTWNTEDFTESFDGGSNTFLVANPPIDEITSVEVSGRELSSGEYFNYGGYVKLDKHTNQRLQNVVIEYSVVAELPLPLKNALIQWVADTYTDQLISGTIDTEDVRTVSVGPVSVNYGQNTTQGTSGDSSSGLLSGVPEVVADVLKMYRKNPL